MELNVAGIVLCGGKSSRMGRPKEWLPFGPEVLLQRVVRILAEVVSPVVVVGARGQELPALPAGVIQVSDEHDALGPLAGLQAGLNALPDTAEAAYVSACDAPLLKTEFVAEMIRRLGAHQIAIPRDGRYHYPLSAVYRTNVKSDVCRLIDAGRLRPFYLIETADTLEVDIDDLRVVDPELASLRNSNTPDEYQAVLSAAGYA